jgi:hypothetical protein
VATSAFGAAIAERMRSAAQILRLKRDTVKVGFLVAVTKFSAPQQVLLDELSVESCFPLDEMTRETCERFAEP